MGKRVKIVAEIERRAANESAQTANSKNGQPPRPPRINAGPRLLVFQSGVPLKRPP